MLIRSKCILGSLKTFFFTLRFPSSCSCNALLFADPRIDINIFNPAIQIYYLSLPDVSDPGAGRDPFQDPKDSDILAEAARDDKEEEEEL